MAEKRCVGDFSDGVTEICLLLLSLQRPGCLHSECWYLYLVMNTGCTVFQIIRMHN